MFEALVFIMIFPLMGIQFAVKRDSCRLLLSPALGVALSVLLGYAISAWTGLCGSASFSAALIILFVSTIVQAPRIISSLKLNASLVSADIILALFACIPAIILVAPGFQYGIGNFFGVINFDFFYNSQDSFYLTNHSVLDFNTGVDDSITPLSWSANQQGRFAISIIASFIHQLLGVNTVHVNSVIVTCLVFVTAITASSFAKYVLNLNLWGSFFAAAVFILSGGYAQGYSYYLLGQISAIPTLLLILIYTNDLLGGELRSNGVGLSKRSAIVMIALLLNVIFVQYAILCFFSVVIIITSTCFNSSWHYRIRRPVDLVHTAHAFGVTVLIFFGMRVMALTQTKKILLDWINISIKTSSRNLTSPAVFSEYTTESFPALLTGIIKYPTNISILNPLLGAGSHRSWALLLVGIIMLGILGYLVLTYCKVSNVPDSVKSIVIGVTLVAIIPAFIFYFNQSGYAIFKIGSWLIPIILIFTVACAFQLQFYKWRSKFFPYVCLVLLGSANILTAVNYSWCFVKNLEWESYENTKNINGLNGIDSLSYILSTTPNKPLLFDFCDGIKMAWIVNEFRGHKYNVLTHNFQPLEDRILLPSVDTRKEIVFPNDSILINDRDQANHKDILSISPAPIPIFCNDNYNVYDTSKLNYYAFIGRGSYPQTNLTPRDASVAGVPQTFRWIEAGLEFFVYSTKKTDIDIEFDLAPGYVKGPTPRTIQIMGDGIAHTGIMQNKITHVKFLNLKVNEGVTRFVIESNDDVQRLPRYGALFRKFVSVDFRLLNFAIGNLHIDFKNNKSE